MNSVRRLDVFLLAVLFAASLALRLWLVLPTGFDGLYGQDAYAYYNFAQNLQAFVSTGQSPGAFFWPLGYPSLLAVNLAIFGTQAAVAQAVSLISGALLTPLVYILARQFRVSRPSAIIAATLMTVSAQALQSSAVIMTDVPALAWAVISAVTLGHYRNNDKQHWLLISAATLTLAGLSRWIYLILALPWAVVVLFMWERRIRWRETMLTGITVIGLFIPQMIFSRTNPFPSLDNTYVLNWSPMLAFRREFINPDGHFVYNLPNALFYAKPFYDTHYLAPLFTPFIIIGLLTLLRSKRYATLVWLGGWASLPYVFLVGIIIQNIRFPLIVFPAVVILVAIGFDTLHRWSQQGANTKSISRYAVTATLAMTFAVGTGMMFIRGRDVVRTFIATHQQDKRIAAWARDMIPPGADVYTFGLTLTLQEYTPLNVHEMYYETPQTLTDNWIANDDDYLLIDVANIESQWAGREPQIAYHWLRDNRGLTEIGRYGAYTLFRVAG
ncbi:MAG: phospholipid carrier-dependent glycosyltransferase [Chloroflexi bacterium]|nr:MAG: phospholipid carrier-dependent glycosyltransferase [Chloroflexota bacterium]